jgi:hypothetical protein
MAARRFSIALAEAAVARVDAAGQVRASKEASAFFIAPAEAAVGKVDAAGQVLKK